MKLAYWHILMRWECVRMRNANECARMEENCGQPIMDRKWRQFNQRSRWKSDSETGIFVLHCILCDRVGYIWHLIDYMCVLVGEKWWHSMRINIRIIRLRRNKFIEHILVYNSNTFEAYTFSICEVDFYHRLISITVMHLCILYNEFQYQTSSSIIRKHWTYLYFISDINIYKHFGGLTRTRAHPHRAQQQKEESVGDSRHPAIADTCEVGVNYSHWRQWFLVVRCSKCRPRAHESYNIIILCVCCVHNWRWCNRLFILIHTSAATSVVWAIVCVCARPYVLSMCVFVSTTHVDVELPENERCIIL